MKANYLFIFLSLCYSISSAQNIQTLTSSNFQFSQENNAVLVTPFNGSFSEGGLLLPFQAGEQSAKTIDFLQYFLAGKLKNGGMVGYLAGRGSNSFGPLNSDGTNSEIFNHAFDTLWVVTRIDIMRYINDWEDGTIDGQHKSIFGWPGRGNDILLSDSVSLPDQDLAPFYDRNGNGIYEPELGEYPSIHGDLSNKPVPTFLSWCVFNTGNSTSKNLAFQNIAYAYSCDSTSLLDNTVFFKIKIQNRGFEFDSLFTGFHFKGALGCDEDDYWGVDTSLNTAYFYNEQPGVAENCQSGARIHPENYRITQAFTLLDKELYSATDKAINEHLGNRFNGTLFELYNMLKGSQNHGEPIPYGWGSPLENDSLTSRYLYTDLPTDTLGWNMPNSDIPLQSNLGPFLSCNLNDFSDMDEAEINFALAAVIDTSDSFDNFSIVQKLIRNDIPEIKLQFESNFTNINCGRKDDYCEPENCVWPGDSNNDQISFLDDFLYTGWLVKEDKKGPKRSFENDQWQAQYAQDWPTNLNGVNYKHYDASGDGVIDQNDLEIIRNNFRKETPYYTFKDWKEPEISDITLSVPDITFNNYTDTPAFYRWISLPVQIESGSAEGIEDLHSICFRISWETPIFDPDNPRYDWPLQFAKSLFVSHRFNSMAQMNEDEIFVALCEPMDTSYNGEFTVAEFQLHMKHDLLDGIPTDSLSTPLLIQNVRALRSDGTEIDLALSNGSITLKNNLTTQTNNTNKVEELSFYPNPASNTLKVRKHKGPGINSISIYDINSVLKLRNVNVHGHEATFDISDFPSGIYISIAELEDGNTAWGRFIVI